MLQSTLLTIKDLGGWLSGVHEDGTLQFDFPNCALARIAEEKIGVIPDWYVHSASCILFCHKEIPL